MRLIRFLRQESRYFSFWLLVAALISGAANAGLLATIDRVVNNPTPGRWNTDYLFPFFLVMGGFLLAQKLMQDRLIKLSQHLIFRMRMGMLDRLRKATFSSFEKIGQEKIFTSLTRDTSIIANTAPGLVYAGTSLITVICCYAYLAWLSWIAFAVAFSVMGAGVALYVLRDKPITAKLKKAREKENEFFRLLNQMLSGFKELKMSNAKSQDLYENYLGKVSAEARDLNTGGLMDYVNNALTAQFFIFILVGMVIFVVPYVSPVSTFSVAGVALLIMYMIGPIEGLINAVPAFSNANVSLSRLDALEQEIAAVKQEVESKAPEFIKAPFKDLKFSALSYAYTDAGGSQTFSLGPLNLSIPRGEILFVIGGNGSGKSTLIRLITGLYEPGGGSILVNGHPLSAGDYPHYRNLMSPVFSDYFLFDRFYGYANVNEQEVNELIAEYGLKEKVTFAEGKFSTLDLSGGQKKRLALIAALIEDKPVFVFDEWAADQDPHFRKYFYEQLLPGLRARGKTIIAVTHDDHYFHCADRVVKMEYGQIERIEAHKLDSAASRI